jgi:hypothetical protein
MTSSSALLRPQTSLSTRSNAGDRTGGLSFQAMPSITPVTRQMPKVPSFVETEKVIEALDLYLNNIVFQICRDIDVKSYDNT